VPAPERTELLALMDANMAAVYAADTRATPGGAVAETPALVMCRTPHGTVATNMAIVTGGIDAATVRARTSAFYGPSGSPFSVWTREHADAGLEAELGALGFHSIHREPGMTFLPGAGAPAPPPPGATVRPVTDDAGRMDYARIMTRAFALYGAPEASTAEHFASLAGLVGPTTQGYLAYRDGRAVAGAILYMAHGVGGIGWVGTLPEEFGRGYGRAVTWAVIAEGFRRGARFMSLQASPMGEPMYRRMGFTTPTHYRWFLAPT
jgi:hypothetical protein